MADRLSEYRSRRDFRTTREPKGKHGRRRRSNLGFYVQKHAARRLHYDLRLEWDGVLLSWAVTKGPSPDPSQKRLAVRTEDHPLPYAEFEGTIPKDDYGGGTVMLWDRGTWEPHDDPDEGLAKGKLSFTVNGGRMRGGWVLVHMKGRKSGGRENWLLIKERDDDAGDDPDELTEACTTSVATGRTMDEIASAEDGGGKAREEYHGIRLTHPHRIVYPGQGVSKSDLAEYYDAVAPRMLPLMQDHPLSLVRCPKGYGKSGGDDARCFFQKHASPGFPEALKRVKLSEKSGQRQDYLYIAGVEGLMAAVQMGTLEFHIWGSRVDSPEKPARLVFDLDPDEGLDFGVVRLAASLVRQRLEDLGLKSVPLVTGGKGVHVVVPLRRTAEWPKVKSFARAFAKSIADEQPDAFTATMSKSRRKGRIFLDWMRNERGSTAIAPYSTRARKNAPIATPVSWKELETLESAATFRIEDVVRRLDKKDPWQHATRWRQSITRPMLDHLAAD